jgi:hypothetical protein
MTAFFGYKIIKPDVVEVTSTLTSFRITSMRFIMDNTSLSFDRCEVFIKNVSGEVKSASVAVSIFDSINEVAASGMVYSGAVEANNEVLVPVFLSWIKGNLYDFSYARIIVTEI